MDELIQYFQSNGHPVTSQELMQFMNERSVVLKEQTMQLMLSLFLEWKSSNPLAGFRVVKPI